MFKGNLVDQGMLVDRTPGATTNIYIGMASSSNAGTELKKNVTASGGRVRMSRVSSTLNLRGSLRRAKSELRFKVKL